MPVNNQPQKTESQRYTDGAAFFLAPLIFPALFTFAGLYITWREWPDSLNNLVDSLGVLLMFSMFAVVIAYFGLLVWGLPAIILLRYLKWENPLSYAIAGAIPVYPLLAFAEGGFDKVSWPAAVPGVMVALTFYWLTQPRSRL